MITSFRVLLDACTLVPATLRDVILCSADNELFRPKWSGQILDEMERALIRLQVPPERAGYTRRQMERAFPEAEVAGYESLVERMRNDPKDRHVLAAAVRGGAQLIVTANISDFPDGVLKDFAITAVTPDEFLKDLLGLYPSQMLAMLRELVQAKRRPPMTELEIL
ncbi:MAG: PIN domain-containing protein [bacterium]|nr:PIN domain-containing protein [bacterium]